MMRFNEYLDRKLVESRLDRCAEILAESDIDPEVFLEGFVSQHNLEEGWGEFWQGAKNFAKNTWNKAWDYTMKTPATNHWHQGIQNMAADKFTKAKNALKALHDFLGKNEQAKGVLSKNKSNMSVTDYIGDLLKRLEQETGIAQLAQGQNVDDAKKAPNMAQMMNNWRANQQIQAAGTQQTVSAGQTAGTQQNVSAGGGANQSTVSSGATPGVGGVWNA